MNRKLDLGFDIRNWVRLDHLVGFEQILERRSFVPPIWLRGPHLQTLGASLVKRKYSWGWRDSQQQFLDLSDGSRIMAVCIWQCSSAPTMVAVHGMGGSSQSTYMQGLSHKAHREGWNAILLNLYNQNRDLCRPKIFHAGASSEIGEIIQKLIDQYNLMEVFLGGASMGGNVLLKFLGERGLIDNQGGLLFCQKSRGGYSRGGLLFSDPNGTLVYSARITQGVGIRCHFLL